MAKLGASLVYYGVATSVVLLTAAIVLLFGGWRLDQAYICEAAGIIFFLNFFTVPVIGAGVLLQVIDK